MNCPKCKSKKTHVVDTQDYGTYIRRRRKCLECGCRFTARERVGYLPADLKQFKKKKKKTCGAI